MNKQEIVDLFDQYLNEKGHFPEFKDFVESQGYNLSELGMKDED